MKKRLYALLALTLAVLLLSACAGGTGSSTPSAAAPSAAPAEPGSAAAPASAGSEVPADAPHVGFVFSDAQADAYHTAHYNEDIRYAKEKGVNLTILDAAGDIDLQIRQIEDMIEMNVDVLMLWALDTNAVVPAVKKAHEAGIPVIVNVKVSDEGMEYVTCYVGADYYSEGVLAGELTVDYFEKNPTDDGTVKVVEIAHLPGNLIGQQRGDGFREGIAGSDIEVIESHSAEGSREKATQLMENYITKYGDDVDVVFIQGDSVAHGAMNAIEAAGKTGEILVVGISLAAESYDRMVNREMYASVLESPLESAHSMIDTAIALANGEEVPETVYIELGPVTWDNVQEIEKPTW